MKANKLSCKDLMVGDWVKPKNVDGSFRVGLIGVDSVWNDTDTHEWYYDEIEPIPLTAEILEKNGFEVQDQGGGRKDVWIGFGIDCEGDIEVEFQHNIPTHLMIDGVFKGEYYTSTNIKYVHLLQHALRLCGVEKTIEL